MDHVDHYGPYILPVAKNEALKPLQIRVWHTQYQYFVYDFSLIYSILPLI